ncbi:glutamate-5-semialdehyde dehydrogenase [Segetibacter sp. 3557_3]|nr:glutamate-5-semialdehyde dehydrogenase [Segetibacter sp. 3557_3]
MKSIAPLLVKTHKAAAELRTIDDRLIKAALVSLAKELEANSAELLKANKKDVDRMAKDDPKADRLLLTPERIRLIAAGIKQVSKLPNPSGKLLEERKLPNGLLLHKFTVPMGVVGTIYESRPNVTFDIAALCLRSKNGCLLKGSQEAEQTNQAAIRMIRKVLAEHGIPAASICLLPSERESVHELLTATRYVDVIIPRGSDALIQYVRKNSLVPVIETGAGVCHVYVEKQADLKKALNIVVNAKVSRPSVCNAMDTLILDEEIAADFLVKLRPLFEQSSVEVFADKKSWRLLKGYPMLQRAGPEDFSREYLSLKCGIRIVRDLDEALEHINLYSTRHSEAIVSENKKQCDRFMNEVDAAVVYKNASTRFTDGMEFGLGAEIGISTQKLHARGPFALEKLVTEKWFVHGSGQIR